MFKNRSVNITLDKKPSQPPTPPVDSRIKRADLEANLQLAKTHARDAAVGMVGVYAAVKTIKTLSEIAINIAPKR